MSHMGLQTSFVMDFIQNGVFCSLEDSAADRVLCTARRSTITQQEIVIEETILSGKYTQLSVLWHKDSLQTLCVKQTLSVSGRSTRNICIFYSKTVLALCNVQDIYAMICAIVK
eukprot:gene8213-10152_t